jgi:hypothetical protein
MLPCFLGIGAQKAGTTWLHAMLSAHNELWLPHRKEIHYFDRKYPSWSRQTAGRHRPARGLIVRRVLGRVRRLRATRAFPSLTSISWRNLKWDFRYFFGEWTDQWYESLFRAAGDRMPGEITPAYSCLDAQAIAAVKTLLPNAKLILLLRDPVDRAWSHAKMELGTYAAQSRLAGVDANFIAHFASPASRLRGDYIGMIERWTRSYGQSRLFVGFYDDILADPVGLLKRIFRFLGVDASEASIPRSARTAVNAGARDPIPLHLHRLLASIYAAELQKLADSFEGYPRLWLQRCNSVLGSP